MIKLLLSLPRRIWDQGWLVLLYTAVIWGCNAIAARMATGEISPMCLVFLRWLIVCSILGWMIRRQVIKDAPILLASWKRLLGMGFAGFTGFSALFYLAAYKTTAVNITILQSSMPPLVLLGAWVFFKERVTGMRLIGMMMALTGIVVIASRGDIDTLTSLAFNIGDLAILLACVLYAAYTLSLRNRPAVPSLVFFFGMSVSALLSSLPLALGEIAVGYAYWPSWTGFGILLFVAFGPSLTAQLAYMRGVELIGPGRASLFPSLVPAFGALLAVMILDEPFAPYHALALMLGLGGIYLSEIKGRPLTVLKTT
ncbi:MAG TPA: DMT family transporter [Methylophilaceae bacterium]|nr:DMT family transporter [Methylophilaceae bacterium]